MIYFCMGLLTLGFFAVYYWWFKKKVRDFTPELPVEKIQPNHNVVMISMNKFNKHNNPMQNTDIAQKISDAHQKALENINTPPIV